MVHADRADDQRGNVLVAEMRLPHPFEVVPDAGTPGDDARALLRPLIEAAAAHQRGDVLGQDWDAMKEEMILYVLRMRDAGFGERIAK